MAKLWIALISSILLIGLPLNGEARGSGSSHSRSSYRPSGYSSRGNHSNASAPVHVRGYRRKNGTYVAPHYRSHPDHSKSNNWSTKGNVNPITGQAGTKNPDPSKPPPTAI